MNKTNNLLSVYLILGMLALSGCGPDITPAPKFTYTAINETGLNIRLTCPTCTAIFLSTGQTLTFGSDVEFSEYTIQATEATTKTIEYQAEAGNQFRITSYEYELRYRLSGTAVNVEVTFINNEGGTSHFPNLQLSQDYYFRDFAPPTAEISAKIISSTGGSVRAIIFHKDKIIKNVLAEGSGATATATATID